MLHSTLPAFFRSLTRVGLIVGAAALAACAQERPAGYYDTPRESTLSDAQHQAQGRRGARAPSQLQMGFGDRDKEEAQKAAAREAAAGETSDEEDAATDPRAVRELLQARTFLGTVPCLNGEPGCPASRVTLTLAPSGEWRSRTVLLGAPGSAEPMIQRGCWDVSGQDPLRIVLKTEGGETRAGFVFINDSVLRVTMYNDVRPALDYHLTRQADIDPIEELGEPRALDCN